MSNTEKRDRAPIINIPNLLTVIRISFIPVIVIILLSPTKGAGLAACWCLAIAGITDVIDGAVARWLKQQSTLGTFLDPIADKLLVNSSLIMLVALGRVPAYLVVILVGRESLITGLRAIAISRGIVISASQWGKYKMWFLMFATGSLMLHFQYFGADAHFVGMILLWIALGFSLFSAFEYIYKFVRGLATTKS